MFLTRFDRFDPMREMATLRNRMSDLFQKFDKEDDLFATTWTPACDVIETEKSYIVKAEIPGMELDDVRVEFENGFLTIKGEREMEKEAKDKNFKRIERSYGSFVRSFAVPKDVDAEHINATFDRGLLNVDIPKKPGILPKQITIKEISGEKQKKVVAA